ncbi:MAG: 1-acyl-sn-glycerol-3-phosphate acyltransferase [Lachnospiraceae bacterium]|nr:1-acyl-sn-glycerol-3-phosphate acyltransferase [Lachnospiraceae bacterium]
MIRITLAMLFLILFLICTIPVMTFEQIIWKKHKDFHDKSSLAIVLWAFRVVLFICGTKVIVKNKENVPTDTPVLYVGNHRSFFDIIITYTLVPRPTGYVAKKELEKVPLLRWWMRHLYCLFLDRNDIKQGLKTILTGVEQVKSGVSMTIFPEGTRNKGEEGTMLPFKEGSFKIAEKANVPVVPMTIVNSSAIFEDHFPRVKPQTVIVDYGTPIYIKELDKETQKNFGTHVREIILNTYTEDKKELPTK